MVEGRDDVDDDFCGKIETTATPLTRASSSQDESLVSWESSVSKGVRRKKATKWSQKRRDTSSGGGVHNRLYARSKAMQQEGREKRQQIAQSLAPKPAPPVKKISAQEASCLFDRLYDDGVQKLISLGRKKNAPEVENVEEKSTTTIISTSEADDLYNRLYSDAITKQLKDMKDMKDVKKQKPKMKIISKKQANTLYERLYLESTLSTQRARVAEE